MNEQIPNETEPAARRRGEGASRQSAGLLRTRCVRRDHFSDATRASPSSTAPTSRKTLRGKLQERRRQALRYGPVRTSAATDAGVILQSTTSPENSQTERRDSRPPGSSHGMLMRPEEHDQRHQRSLGVHARACGDVEGTHGLPRRVRPGPKNSSSAGKIVQHLAHVAYHEICWMANASKKAQSRTDLR